MKRLLFAIFSIFLSGFFLSKSFATDLSSMSADISKKLIGARYMEGDCQRVEVVGWEGFETEKCTYRVNDARTKKSKHGMVVMLNPDAERLSAWVVNACKSIRPEYPVDACSDFLLKQIFRQSGGQFPVAGVVYEDIYPEKGVYEAYFFKDGVTVVTDIIKHRDENSIPLEVMETALSRTPLRTASEDAYARIIGVTRKQFKKFNPKASVEGLSWLSTVREEYKKAWRSDHNTLIEAWLYSAKM